MWRLKNKYHQKDPDERFAKGSKNDDPVELLDIFPTLVDLARLPTIGKCPSNLVDSRNTKVCTDGKSLLGLKTEEEQLSITQYPRPSFNPQRNTGF